MVHIQQTTNMNAVGGMADEVVRAIVSEIVSEIVGEMLSEIVGKIVGKSVGWGRPHTTACRRIATTQTAMPVFLEVAARILSVEKRKTILH